MLLFGLVVGSALAWGSVHEWPTLALSAGLAIAGMLRLGLRGGLRVGAWSLLMGVPLLLGLAQLVPLPVELRAWVQPGWVVFETVGWRPLAVDPRGAAVGVALASSLALVGVSLSVRRLPGGWLEGAIGVGGLAVVLWEGVSWWIGDGPGFGPFRNPNHAGVWMALAATLWAASAVRRTGVWRWISVVGALLFALACVATASRAGIGLGLLGVWLALLFELGGRRRLGVGIAGLVGGGGLLVSMPLWFVRVSEWLEVGSTSRGLAGGRMDFVEQAIAALMSVPFVGAGPGGFAVLQPIVKTSPDWARAAHVHLDPLEFLVSFGWVAGGVGLLGGLVGLARVRRLRGEAAALLVVGLAACVGFPLHISSLALLGMSLFATVLPPTRPGWLPRGSAAGLVLPVLVAMGLLASSPTTSAFGPHPDKEAIGASTPEACADWIAAHPLDGGLRFACGRRHADRGAIEVAVELDPSHPFPRWALARQALKAGQTELAARSFTAALVSDLPPGMPARAWLREALASEEVREDVIAGLQELRPEVLCADLDLLPSPAQRAPELAGRSARCALILAESEGRTGDAETALQWLDPWPVDCGRQRLGARLSLQLGRPADALSWLRPASEVCLSGDPEVETLTRQAREAVGISPR